MTLQYKHFTSMLLGERIDTLTILKILLEVLLNYCYLTTPRHFDVVLDCITYRIVVPITAEAVPAHSSE